MSDVFLNLWDSLQGDLWMGIFLKKLRIRSSLSQQTI